MKMGKAVDEITVLQVRLNKLLGSYAGSTEKFIIDDYEQLILTMVTDAFDQKRAGLSKLESEGKTA